MSLFWKSDPAPTPAQLARMKAKTQMSELVQKQGLPSYYDPCSAPPEPDPEPVTSEILAWRGWLRDTKNDYEPVLRSFNYDVRWDGPSLTADKVPSRKHDHGIYALKATPGKRHEQSSYYFNAFAFGCVALSGVVVEGELGYRAERATIRELWLCGPEARGSLGERHCAIELAGMLEQRYQVDVHLACEDWAEWKFIAEDAAKIRAMRYASGLYR